MAHKEKSGLATAGMVLGIIGICLSLIPIINNIAFILALLGLVFGIIGIVQTKGGKKAGKGKAIAAVILAVATIGLVLVSQATFSDAFDEATKVGETESKPKENEQTEFKVGEVISFDDKEVTVKEVIRNWTKEYTEAPSGKEYVKILVDIKNNSDQEISISDWDWSLQDSTGTIHEYSTEYDDDNFKSGSIAPGGTASGSVIYEVPAGDTNLTLRYEPSFWSSRKLQIKLQ